MIYSHDRVDTNAVEYKRKTSPRSIFLKAQKRVIRVYDAYNIHINNKGGSYFDQCVDVVCNTQGMVCTSRRMR